MWQGPRYEPCGHLITWQFRIILNDDLEQLPLESYREETSINWGYKIKIIFIANEKYSKCGQRKKTKIPLRVGTTGQKHGSIKSRLSQENGKFKKAGNSRAEVCEEMFERNLAEVCICSSR